MDRIRAIIKRCGGINAVAAETGAGRWAVIKWPHNGIPERHWAALRRLDTSLTLEDLHSVNEAMRSASDGDGSTAAPGEAAA